ncbi:MAG: pyrimidine 5'-nucleotidase [Alphaproteobacteria bacterium]|nr:pyrimidine 5'-nucleotidase [Alphaproteobacteria bacterium]
MAPPAKPTPASSPPDLSRIEAWVFDLDNTLYPASCRLFAQVEVRIRDYVARYLGLDADAAFRLQKTYFRDHGTTMRGMMSRHGMDPEPFLAYVHDIDLSAIRPDPALDRALGRLEGRKIIFTNGSTAHAERVMERIGVARHFEAVFDIADADYVPKPEPRVYDALVSRHVLAARATAMVEDIARNLVPAAEIGMTTIWVRGGAGRPADGLDPPDADVLAAVDHVVDDLVPWLARLTGARANLRARQKKRSERG